MQQNQLQYGGQPAPQQQFAGPGQGQAPQFGAPVDPYDMLEGGKRAIKFVTKDVNGFDQHAPVGTSFTGLIVGDLRSAQQTDFTTKAPKFYADGRPMNQVVMDLQTNDRDPQDPTDDGVRALYVKNQMLAAFQQALQSTRHLGRIGEGTRVTVTLVGYKDSGKGNPQKLYEIAIGPEFVPYVDPAQRQATQAIYGQAAPQPQAPQQFAQPQAPQQFAQPQAPQQAFVQPVQPQAPQYAEPAQPQFPGQVVPAAQPAQPVAPQPASPALAALNAITDAPSAPTAPAPGGLITPQVLETYQLVAGNGIDPHTAINSVAARMAPGNEAAFAAELAAAVGVQLA